MGSSVHREPIPVLRTDLELGPRGRPYVDVRDPRLLNVYTLEGSYLDIADAFDGRRGADEVRRALRERGLKVDEAAVVEAAEALEALLLLDTAEARAAEPSVENSAPHALLDAVDKPLKRLPVIQPDTRWSCHACGACCHGLAVELSEAEEARIDASLYQDVLKGEPFAVDAFIDPELPAQRILRQREPDQACVFLSEDGLCLVHARQGMTLKPDACQIFPYAVVHIPKQAPRLAVRTNCHTMHETWKTGEAAEAALPEIRRLMNTHAAQRAPKKARFFGKELGIDKVVGKLDRASAVLEADGVGPASLAALDEKILKGRARASRKAFGRALLAYAREEREGEVPVEAGGLWEHLSVLRSPLAALESMGRGKNPPAARPEVARFLARQARLALHGLGPLNLPDAGVGLVGLVLALEACLHAVGEKGRLPRANRAFMAYTAPILENTAHAWPLIEAIDPDFASTLREVYGEAFA